ncbi:hypothetical protein [Anaerophilus nitritogenes]|nr:hypothetical protein [Anaerophilus nitritogenes]
MKGIHIWDIQWDMFMALCGAVISLVVLNKVHDRILKKNKNRTLRL